VVHKISLRLCKVNNTKELCLVKILEIVVLVQGLHTDCCPVVSFLVIVSFVQMFGGSCCLHLQGETLVQRDAAL